MLGATSMLLAEPMHFKMLFSLKICRIFNGRCRQPLTQIATIANEFASASTPAMIQPNNGTPDLSMQINSPVSIAKNQGDPDRHA